MRQTPSAPEHDFLPENSQGKSADNPETLDIWQTGGGVLAISEWPYLMLCRDQDNDSLTWHMLCNDYNIPRIISTEMKTLVDNHMSAERTRNLVGIELLCRHGNIHMVLDE